MSLFRCPLSRSNATAALYTAADYNSLVKACLRNQQKNRLDRGEDELNTAMILRRRCSVCDVGEKVKKGVYVDEWPDNVHAVNIADILEERRKAAQKKTSTHKRRYTVIWESELEVIEPEVPAEPSPEEEIC